MIFPGIAVLVFLLDYFVKKHIEQTRQIAVEEKKIGGRMIIRRTPNYGLSGSRWKDKPKLVCLLHSITMLFVGAAYIRLLMENGRNGLKVAGAFILGGGGSNLYDRIKKGYVTDYLNFQVPVKAIQRLVFNISDFFILAGSILALILSLKDTSVK